MKIHPIKTLSAAALIATLAAGCSSNSGGTTQAPSERIKADQIGYNAKSVKIAIVPDGASDDFQIVDIQDNVVYKGKTSAPATWWASGTSVKQADFSDFDQPGVYTIMCDGAEKSYPFAIGDNIYTDLAIAATKSFYFARTGVEITQEHGGKYARPAAHPDTQVKVHKSAAGPKRKEGDIISSPGGWYDAGDYNKYIVNSSITVWELLNAVELHPEFAKSLNLNIPESGNNIPDIVDELLFNLRWMITMQDPADGGVYHKLTALGFNGMIMPQDDHDERYVIKKSTAAALDLAATCAKAYRVLKPYDAYLPGLRDSLMKVADKAWDWAQKNPTVLYDRNPEGVMTGQYDDIHVRDEFSWAAIELTIATGNSKRYMTKIAKDDFEFATPAWDSSSILGVMSALNKPEYKDLFDAEMYDFMKGGLIKLADQYLNDYQRSPYATPLAAFPWGSNSVAANQGIVLAAAYRITGNTKYLEAAQADLHYILGRNPLDYCYVTGFGVKTVKDVHDRRSVADGIEAPVPGYLCGGPNATAKGDIPDSLYQYNTPAMRYCDINRSYTTNEIAINWNAALIGLVFDVNN